MSLATSRLVRSSAAAVSLLVFAGLAESLGCQPSPPAPNGRIIGAGAANPSTTAGPASVPTSAGGPSTTPAEPEPAAAPERLPREVTPGPTKGTIACGDRRCAAGTEVCGIVDPDLAWACVPTGQPELLTHSSYECDDPSDCSGGKTCCRSFASADEAYICAKRGQGCRMEVCVEGDGAPCPKKQQCSSGLCVPEKDERATCAERRQCDAAKPICKWDGTGECIELARAEKLFREIENPDADFSLFACTQNSDCGAGFHCCTGMRGPKLTFCSLECDLLNGYQFCKTSRDCPAGDGFKFTCKTPGEVGVSMPSWSRVCVLGE